MTEMTEERAQIIVLKRKLRDMKAERDRYQRQYLDLLEARPTTDRLAQEKAAQDTAADDVTTQETTPETMDRGTFIDLFADEDATQGTEHRRGDSRENHTEDIFFRRMRPSKMQAQAAPPALARGGAKAGICAVPTPH